MKTTMYTLIALIAMMLAGCTSSGDIEGIDDSALSADLTLLPTESELQARLGLSENQTAAMGLLLAGWRRGMESGENAVPGEGMHKRGESMMAFIEEAAGVLDHEQIVELLEFLAERKETMQGENRPAGGQGMHGRPTDGEAPPLLRIFELLDLNDEQQTAIRAFRDVYRETHDAPAPGDPEARREFMREMREAMQEFLATLLTEDQLAELDGMQDTRRLEQIQRRLDSLDEHFDGRVEFLTAVLRLDSDQSAALTELADATLAAKRALLEGVDENTDFDELRDAMRTIREEMDTALRALLNAEQLEVLDALQELMHRGPGH